MTSSNASPATLRFTSITPKRDSDNRGICGSLTLAQISPYGETSHIPGRLAEIPHTALGIFKTWRKLH